MIVSDIIVVTVGMHYFRNVEVFFKFNNTANLFLGALQCLSTVMKSTFSFIDISWNLV